MRCDGNECESYVDGGDGYEVAWGCEDEGVMMGRVEGPALPVEAELQAIRNTVASLGSVGVDARRRILDYLWARFGDDGTPAPVRVVTAWEDERRG